MLDETLFPRDRAVARPIEKDEVEVLEWMGTAYGRRSQAAPLAGVDDEAAAVPIPADAIAVSSAGRASSDLISLMLENRGAITAIVVAGIAAFTIQLQRGRNGPGPVSNTETARALHADAALLTNAAESRLVVAPAAPDPSDQALRAAADARAELATEREARLASERQATQLATDLAAATRAREQAETTIAEASAQLEAERKTRADAEQAVGSAKDELARQASAATPAPAAEQNGTAQSPPIGAADTEATHRPQETAPGIKAGTTPDDATSELREGEKLFAKGELARARRIFESLAAKGHPEGALAAGNTFDALSLAQAGLKQPGDPARALRWYRRAYELAQVRPRQVRD